MLVLKTLFHIGMEKIVPDKHSRRHSTGNLAFEYTDVLSRYLKDPVSSCHDNCKPLDDTTPERSNKTPLTSKKFFTPIPKHSTKDVKITSTSLLKPLPMEPKRHEFLKSKSKIKSNDPFYIPPSRTHRRRYSEIILPTGGLGDVFDPPKVPCVTRTSSKKIDSKTSPRKDSKPNSVKTSGNVNVSKKAQTLKTPNSSPKLGVDHGSRKSKPAKPVEETVQEKTDKTCSPTSNERVIENGCNEAQISSTSKKDETIKSHDGNNNGCDESQQISSTSKKDETHRSNDQNNGVGASGGKQQETQRRVGKMVKENGDNLPQKIKLKQGKIVDPQSSSGCSSSSSRKLKSRQQVVDEKNQNQDDNNRVSLKRMSSNGVLQRQASSKSVNAILKAHDLEKKKHHLGLNNVIEETASKLIQTRKSRVQALVGAFEMISESKL